VEEYLLIHRRSRNWLFILVSLLVLAAIFFLTRLNHTFIQNNPGGGQSFIVQWVSLRGFLIDSISPYSQESVNQAQRLVYGRLAQPGEDQMRFISPLYSAVIFFPIALIPDIDMARAVWMTILEVALLLLAYFSIRLVNWRPGLVGMVLFFLFAVFWFHSFQPLIEGDPIILVALMLVGALIAIRNGADELAGLLLALTTIRLNVILLPLLFILLWAGAHRRSTILWWMGGTTLLLSAIAALLQPNWILQNAWQIISFESNAPPGNIRTVLIELLPEMGNRVGWAVMAVVAVIVAVEWFILRRAEFRGFLWAIYLTIVASMWLGPYTDPGNYILILPVLVLIFAMWEERWRRGGSIISIGAMILLFGGIWWLYLSNNGFLFERSLELVFFFPLPILLVIVLYWVRWWAVRPPMWFDLIYEQENPGQL
jgi:hypothetical protein